MSPRDLLLGVVAALGVSCASWNDWPAAEAQPLTLHEVFIRRDELSGQRVTVEAFLFSAKYSAALMRADEGRLRIGAERDSCPRSSDADLVIVMNAATSRFGQAYAHRVVISGVLRPELTEIRLEGVIIEYPGRLEEVRLERVYEDRCIF